MFNRKFLKKIPFQPCCDCKESKCTKNTHFHMGGVRNAMANIFPSDSVLGQGINILRQHTSFCWLTNTVPTTILSSQD